MREWKKRDYFESTPRGFARLFFWVIMLSLFLHPGQLNGQNKPYEVGFKFSGGIPMGSFKSYTDEPGFGVEAHFGYQVDQVPLTVGYELGYFVFGGSHYSETFGPDTSAIRRKIANWNNIASLRLLARAGPQSGWLRPYIDGLAGFNYHYTLTRVRDKREGEIIQHYSHLDVDDFTWTYGAGAGVKIKVQEIERPFSIQKWFLDFRAVYLRTESAHFILEKPVLQADGSIDFKPEYAPVDILSLQLGFTIYFSKF